MVFMISLRVIIFGEDLGLCVSCEVDTLKQRL